MNIALVGTGQMGQAVEKLAIERGHAIVARFDDRTPLTSFENAQEAGITGADVAIDFTLPAIALEHIRRYTAWRVPAVIGTTGWYGALAEVRALVERHQASILYAPNFSMGVALLVRALQGIAPLLNALPEYDAFVHEVHHVKKVDSPSGTALLLANVLRDGLERKHTIESETIHGRIDPEAIHVSSTRAGGVIGKHTVGLDSPFDYIEFVHEAKSRQGFAFGAVKAAEWLAGKKGLFTLEDVINDYLGQNVA